jgi:response regulator NasT
MSSILIANSNLDSAKKIAAVLRSGGLNVSSVCSAGFQVIDFTNRHYQGGVVICSEKLTDMPAVNLPRLAGAGYDFVFLVKNQPVSLPSFPSCINIFIPINRMALISTVNMLLNIADYSSLSVKKELLPGTMTKNR